MDNEIIEKESESNEEEEEKKLNQSLGQTHLCKSSIYITKLTRNCPASLSPA
jgi:hypothetical protein